MTVAQLRNEGMKTKQDKYFLELHEKFKKNINK